MRQSAHRDQGGVCCWQIANLPKSLAGQRENRVGITVVDAGRDRTPRSGRLAEDQVRTCQVEMAAVAGKVTHCTNYRGMWPPRAVMPSSRFRVSCTGIPTGF